MKEKGKKRNGKQMCADNAFDFLPIVFDHQFM